ncbi:MAG: hypothetical protein KatS3mg129_1655 [Leptospiraceae bacterium]|nr:MAG: hypothetical protein KatS3mg129_1655 [Leptospiraceae bacterium]
MKVYIIEYAFTIKQNIIYDIYTNKTSEIRFPGIHLVLSLYVKALIRKSFSPLNFPITFNNDLPLKNVEPSIPVPLFLLPITHYIPPKEIIFLGSIIRETKDKKFLTIYKNMLISQKKIFQSKTKDFIDSKDTAFYIPTKSEIDLIAIALYYFLTHGFLSAPLPQIYLSFKEPPLLKEALSKEEIPIEKVLGEYIAEPYPVIILYQKGIRECSLRFHFDEELLRAIVLIHEVGHWITHLLPEKNSPSWPITNYKNTSSEVHEGWAQLITYFVVLDVLETRGEIKNVFLKLLNFQPPQYHVFKKFTKFIKIDIEKVIQSLIKLRELNRPATLEDWENFLK